MLRKLINKILLVMGKPPPDDEEYQIVDCVGFWIDSNENDEYDDEGY